MLGSLILYLKGMRTIMFQLSSFYCKPSLKVALCRLVGSGRPRASERLRALTASHEDLILRSWSVDLEIEGFRDLVI